MKTCEFNPFGTNLSQDDALNSLKLATLNSDDGELFFEQRQTETITFDDGRVRSANFDTSEGMGLRSVYGEITGYGATSDGYDMVQPSGEGAVRSMKKALKNLNTKIDYINSHGTSTPIGDIKELEAIKNVFENDMPLISSTKSLTGHSLGATGVHEAIYCILMMKNNFISGSANIDNLDEKAKDYNILLNTLENKNIDNVMSNSFGFGGTNATLLFSKYHD